MNRPSQAKLGKAAVATALLLSAMWGLNIVGIKVALGAFPPVWNAFWRLLLGWPALWLWARVGKVRLRLESGEARPLMLLGAFFAVQIIMLNVSIDWTSAAFASVLLNAAPIFVNVIAHYAVPGDRLSLQRGAGLALAFGGMAVALLGRPDAALAPKPLWGNTLAIVTAAVIGGRMVYTKHVVESIHSTKAVFWQVGFSLPIFLAVAAVSEPMLVGPLGWGPVLSWLYCSFGVVGIGFVLWIRLLEANAPGLISVFVFPTPVFGVLFSALVYREALAFELVAGVLGVAFGILLVTLEKRHREVHGADRESGRLRTAA